MMKREYRTHSTSQPLNIQLAFLTTCFQVKIKFIKAKTVILELAIQDNETLNQQLPKEIQQRLIETQNYDLIVRLLIKITCIKDRLFGLAF